MTGKSSPPEAFSALLQEKLDELDAAAEHEAYLVHDEVEQLRLRAAYLVSATDGKPWHTGAAVHFQGNLSEMDAPPPTLDISYPAGPYAPPTGLTAGSDRAPPAAPGRQGRRIPG